MIRRILLTIIEHWNCFCNNLNFKLRAEISPKGLKILGKIYVFNSNITMGENVVIYPGVTFMGEGPIRIGDNCKIGQNVIIYAAKDAGISIGDDTIIAAQSYLIDSDHGMLKDELIASQDLISSKIEIGKDVWLGANVTITKGVTICDGAVIGAKALVNENVDAYTINVGIPCKKIGVRK